MEDEKIFPEVDKPGYWAVLPSSVRYDARLRPNEKILYAEITALASRDGFCWADNKYFADLYGMAEHSIQTFIRDLEKYGYINVEIIQKGNQRQPERRRIWIDGGAFDRFRSVLNKTEQDENTGAPSQKIRAPSQKIFYTIDNNKKEYNTCSISTMPDSERELAERERANRERFEDFWKLYKSTVPHTVSVGAKQRALKAWNKLKPNDAAIAAMALALKKQSEMPDWQRGVGIPHAATWLNQRRWEEMPECGEASHSQQPQRAEVEQW